MQQRRMVGENAMEFHEKLQELRKSRNLTQEELAEALYVSRTAVSKWESGRGYPSIGSLKEISRFFSVTIDDLLSGEKLLSIAERENQSNIRRMRDLLFGALDVCALMLIFLPLYPKTVDGFVYGVNLFDYAAAAPMQRFAYWLLILLLIATGVLKLLLTRLGAEKGRKTVTVLSVIFSIAAVLLLAVTRESYAVVVAFLLLVGKGILMIRK